MHFLLPQSPLSRRQPDELVAEQYAALGAAGHGLALFSVESLQAGDARFAVTVPVGARVVYRGWMLSADEYARLGKAVNASGGAMAVGLEQYLAAHHLPNWLPLVREFTAETVVMRAEEVTETAVRALGWEAFFIKDYVKSLKTSIGSLVADAALVPKVIAEMRHYRGRIEGGICLRRAESFVPETELRYFVINGIPFGPTVEETIPDLVKVVAARIQSPFFSLDVAWRTDGVLRLVEVGDGQVSDLVGWTPERFAALWSGR